MKEDELRDLITGLTCDIEFSYKGVHGCICPLSKSDISLCWNGKYKECNSIEEIMTETTVLGASLMEICDQIEFG